MGAIDKVLICMVDEDQYDKEIRDLDCVTIASNKK